MRGSDAVFDAGNARKRIVAQLETLIGAKRRHVVLSAFGCGAFKNPAEVIARIYAEEIRLRQDEFDAIAFAVHHPGYGDDNFPVFVKALSGVKLCAEAKAVSGVLHNTTLYYIHQACNAQPCSLINLVPHTTMCYRNFLR